jgi:hypothetical protein
MVPLVGGAFAWISWQRAGAPYLPLPVISTPVVPFQYQFSATIQSVEQWVPPGIGQPLGLPGLIMAVIICGVACVIAAWIALDLASKAHRAIRSALQPRPPAHVVSGIFRHDAKPALYAELEDDEEEDAW